MDLLGVRRLLFLLIAVFAVGSGCVCKGQPMRWPRNALHAEETPADVQRSGDRSDLVLWVLEWNGETGTPVPGAKTALVCRFHRLTEKGRPKLSGMRFLEPLVLSSDELIATDEAVVVHSDVDLEDFKWALERRGPLGVWLLRVESTEDRVVYRSSGLPCEVRRQTD